MEIFWQILAREANATDKEGEYLAKSHRQQEIPKRNEKSTDIKHWASSCSSSSRIMFESVKTQKKHDASIREVSAGCSDVTVPLFLHLSLA